MRILLVHPEDSPRRGAWSRQRWDLIVDLGKSSRYSEQAWSDQFGCPVWRADSFRYGVADAKKVRQMLATGRGRLLDEEGIDWWEMTSLLIVPEALNLLAFQRIAAEIESQGISEMSISETSASQTQISKTQSHTRELWSTRAGWPANLLAILLHQALRSFDAGQLASLATSVGHYAGLMRRFSLAQIKEICLDKYDSGYRWRARFAEKTKPGNDPVVLLPTAYGNVSRMAADYARMLPHQKFLMVATRQSAKQFTPPANVEVRDLASYAAPDSSTRESASLIERWTKLQAELCSLPEFDVLAQAGVLDPAPIWIREGISARDAWCEVLKREPVCGVLCGDDSNVFTRLPVPLAAKRKIPTADFHHGAFDGRYLLKDLLCDVYLAKNPMERDYLVRVCSLPEEKVVIAAPAAASSLNARRGEEREPRSIVLFSEPYEAAGMRAEEFYRELLPELVWVAREQNRRLIIKLHPFESRPQRERLARQILGSNAELATILDGPLRADLIAQAWCGITIESTTVIDCWQNGVCCFLCGWLTFSPFEYAEQYARFGIGEVLQRAEQIREIPARLAEFQRRPSPSEALAAPVDAQLLQQLLTSRVRKFPGALHEHSGARSRS